MEGELLWKYATKLATEGRLQQLIEFLEVSANINYIPPSSSLTDNNINVWKVSKLIASFRKSKPILARKALLAASHADVSDSSKHTNIFWGALMNDDHTYNIDVVPWALSVLELTPRDVLNDLCSCDIHIMQRIEELKLLFQIDAFAQEDSLKVYIETLLGILEISPLKIWWTQMRHILSICPLSYSLRFAHIIKDDYPKITIALQKYHVRHIRPSLEKKVELLKKTKLNLDSIRYIIAIASW